MATRPMAFISYRRDDTRDWANLISDTIRRQLGRDAVFLDTDSIRIGDAWNRRIEDSLKLATVILPLIGPRWLFLHDPSDGRRRIDLDDDWVRQEVEYALKSGIPLLPVLVGGAQPLNSQSLPASISALATVQGRGITDKRDIDFLITHLVERYGFERLKAELDFPTPVDRSPELPGKDVQDALQRLPGWRLEERDSERGKDGIAIELVSTLKFRTFEDVIHFMATAARYVSTTDHHPFWENQYKDLRIRISTWDIGLRISSKDIRLAEYLQRLYRDYVTEEPGNSPGNAA
jgi:pterin-4a-carbinolamine dehydratase